MASLEHKNITPSTASNQNKREDLNARSISNLGDTIILEIIDAASESTKSITNSFSQFQSSATQSIFGSAKEVELPVYVSTLKFLENPKESTSGVMTGYLMFEYLGMYKEF